MRRDALDGLLGRGRLPGPTRDRILEGALRDAEIVRPRWYRRKIVLWGSPALACAAAIALFVAVRAAPDDDMRSKGGDHGDRGIVSVECAGRAAGTCAASDLIMFRLEAIARDGLLAAYAEPAAGGERIWFFPQADGRAPAVRAAEAPQVVREGVLARALAPGRYRVHLVVSTRPLSKPEILAASLAASGPDLIVVGSAPLEVTP